MRVEDVAERTKLPCGCIVGIHEDDFVMIPCDPECSIYRLTMPDNDGRVMA